MKIVKIYHADHGVGIETLEEALTRLAPAAGFFAATTDLPEGHEPLMSALYGPLAGDAPVDESEVVYIQRTPDRPMSRMVRRPARPVRRLTLVGVAAPEGATVFTAYGGELAEREPGDKSLAPGSPELERAQKFWRDHALALAE